MESKVGSASMFEGIPVVGGDVVRGASGCQPGVEGGLLNGEDKVIRAVVDRGSKERECSKGSWQEAGICALALLVSLGEGHPEVLGIQEDIAPAEEEDLAWTDKGVEGEGEDGIVMDLEWVVGCEELVEVVEGDPEGWLGTLV